MFIILLLFGPYQLVNMKLEEAIDMKFDDFFMDSFWIILILTAAVPFIYSPLFDYAGYEKQGLYTYQSVLYFDKLCNGLTRCNHI